MKAILRTERLQPSELQALFGEEKDYSCSLNDIVHHTEYAVHHQQRPVFSNQDYYIKLDELKKEHLRNMAELENLYLSQIRPAQRERPISTSWRHSGEDTESEQMELIQVGRKVSVGRLKNEGPQSNYKTQQISMEEHKMLHQSSHSAANQLPENQRRYSKITIPKPFRMMLREDDRKRRNVKTRSEIELENDRLKKELDELKECGKKFRAKPVPATTHLLLYEIINQRPNKLQQQKNPSSQKDQGRGTSNQAQRHSAPLPFSFIERERKKREKKLADELNSMTPRAKQTVFKARPVPRSLYRSSSPNSDLYEPINLNHRCTTLHPSILKEEEEYHRKFSGPKSTDISRRGSNFKKWKNKVEEEMERKRNRERERDWSYIHPLRKTSFCQEPQNTCKNDYISV
ncbi:protein FAM161A-like isoform X2 [Danio rerio]|uniref:Protein FAM161A-like isoform X2 n=1 Tax=Danio rerio TaxID=7955 RepID=A0AC58HRR0_DANRE